MSELRYWWKAFVARPLGMPVPPNFFGLAAFAVLGVFLSPGFLAAGLGLEIGYLAWLANSKRFRNHVDAQASQADPVDQRYAGFFAQLDASQQQRQRQIEARSREIFATLGQSSLLRTHIESLEQLVWLHLRLLVARQAIAGVVKTATAEHARLEAQEAQIVARLESADVGPDLRRSLEQQKTVIDQRQDAHASAGRRLEHVDAELDRIDQQIALIREQALLATDDEHIGSSLDALAASFNEANHWLNSQRDLLSTIDLSASHRLPQSVLRGPPPLPTKRQHARVSQ
jgi:chromosome segregation ATPase